MIKNSNCLYKREFSKMLNRKAPQKNQYNKIITKTSKRHNKKALSDYKQNLLKKVNKNQEVKNQALLKMNLRTSKK